MQYDVVAQLGKGRHKLQRRPPVILRSITFVGERAAAATGKIDRKVWPQQTTSFVTSTYVSTSDASLWTSHDQVTAAVVEQQLGRPGVKLENGVESWIDGQDKFSAVTIAPGAEVVIEAIGFTSCNSHAGSAVLNMGVLLMVNVELYRNQADYGGAIFNDGILKLEHVTADSNAGRRCGSVLYGSLGEPPGKTDVKRSIFTNNYQVRLSFNQAISHDVTHAGGLLLL